MISNLAKSSGAAGAAKASTMMMVVVARAGAIREAVDVVGITITTMAGAMSRITAKSDTTDLANLATLLKKSCTAISTLCSFLCFGGAN